MRVLDSHTAFVRSLSAPKKETWKKHGAGMKDSCDESNRKKLNKKKKIDLHESYKLGLYIVTICQTKCVGNWYQICYITIWGDYISVSCFWLVVLPNILLVPVAWSSYWSPATVKYGEIYPAVIKLISTVWTPLAR